MMPEYNVEDCNAMIDTIKELEERIEALREALRDAIDGYEECASYKGDYLFNKHGDGEELEHLNSILEEK